MLPEPVQVLVVVPLGPSAKTGRQGVSADIKYPQYCRF